MMMTALRILIPLLLLASSLTQSLGQRSSTTQCTAGMAGALLGTLPESAPETSQDGVCLTISQEFNLCKGATVMGKSCLQCHRRIADSSCKSGLAYDVDCSNVLDGNQYASIYLCKEGYYHYYNSAGSTTTSSTGAAVGGSAAALFGVMVTMLLWASKIGTVLAQSSAQRQAVSHQGLPDHQFEVPTRPRRNGKRVFHIDENGVAHLMPHLTQ